MAKLQASEAAHRAADKALQILASAGYQRGSDVERYFRDARAAEIYSGTSEVQRMVIAEQILGVRAAAVKQSRRVGSLDRRQLRSDLIPKIFNRTGNLVG